MSIKKLTILILLSLVLVGSVLTYKSYKRYLFYVKDSILKDESRALYDLYESYYEKYYSPPKTVDSFVEFIKNEIGQDSLNSYKLLKYGFNFKLDTSRNTSSISAYSYGPDQKDDRLNQIINESHNDSIKFAQISFLEFLRIKGDIFLWERSIENICEQSFKRLFFLKNGKYLDEADFVRKERVLKSHLNRFAVQYLELNDSSVYENQKDLYLKVELNAGSINIRVMCNPYEEEYNLDPMIDSLEKFLDIEELQNDVDLVYFPMMLFESNLSKLKKNNK